MSTAIFLVSVIVSASMFLGIARIMKESQINHLLLSSTAAFYTAESSRQLSWSHVKPDKGVEVLVDFLDEVDHTQIISESNKDYLSASIGEGLILNQGIGSKSIQEKLKARTKPFLEEYDQSSLEISFFVLRPDQYFDDFSIDYCYRDEDICADLIVDVIQIEGGGIVFSSIDKYRDDPSINHSSFRRDIFSVRGTSIDRDGNETGVLVSTNTGGYENWKRRFSIFGFDFQQGYSYMIRLRSEDGGSFRFQISVLRQGEEMPFPNTTFEVDGISRSRNSYRRIREQKQFSGGLQNGLEYGVSINTLENKSGDDK